MAEKKSTVKHDIIPEPACVRVLKHGSQMGDSVRVGAGAAAEAQQSVIRLLKEVAAHVTKDLTRTKKKTLNFELLKIVFLENLRCHGIRENDLIITAPVQGVGRRGLPKAGCEKQLRKNLPKDTQITEEAKLGLLGACEAYLRELGKRGGLYAKAGKRITIQKDDVVSARKTLVA
jgi:histone H3/H4